MQRAIQEAIEAFGRRPRGRLLPEDALRDLRNNRRFPRQDAPHGKRDHAAQVFIGQQPQTPEEIIAWLEATACSWNETPTAFEWGGNRATRRARSRARRHAVGGSGACTRHPVRRKTIVEKWRHPKQVTH